MTCVVVTPPTTRHPLIVGNHQWLFESLGEPRTLIMKRDLKSHRRPAQVRIWIASRASVPTCPPQRHPAQSILCNFRPSPRLPLPPHILHQVQLRLIAAAPRLKQSEVQARPRRPQQLDLTRLLVTTLLSSHIERVNDIVQLGLRAGALRQDLHFESVFPPQAVSGLEYIANSTGHHANHFFSRLLPQRSPGAILSLSMAQRLTEILPY